MWAQQWPQVWLDAAVQCVQGVMQQSGVPPASVQALWVCSLNGSSVAVDADGKPLCPCLIWIDRRTQRQVDWVRGTADVERVWNITGNGVDSDYGYTKELWLRDEHPDIWNKIHQFLPPNTYINVH